MNKAILKRIKKIEEIIKASSDPDEIRAYLKELLSENRKSLAELMAALDTDTLRAIAYNDSHEEAEKIFVEAVRALQKGGRV